MQNQAKNHLSTVEYIQNKIEYFIFKQIFGNTQLRGAFAQYWTVWVFKTITWMNRKQQQQQQQRRQQQTLI